MEFTTPTTEKEMLAILKEIYTFYRIKKDPFSVPELPTISLQEIHFEKMTEEEIFAHAKELLKGEHQKEILQKKESLEKQILEKISLIEKEKERAVEKEKELILNCSEKIKILEEDGEKNGLIKGSVIGKKKLDLFEKRNAEIEEKKKESLKTINKLQGEIASLNECLDNVEEYFLTAHQSEIESKVAELKQKQFEFMVEVQKYNNSVQERNIKYANYIESTRANLELKYIEIRSEPFTKEELIEIGYYEDVINCVNAYYAQIDDSRVYNEFVKCPQLVMYLEDFHTTLQTFYKILSNNS